MIFPVLVVGVGIDDLGCRTRRKFEDDRDKFEERNDHFGMTIATELLDRTEVVLYHCWVFTVVQTIKLRDVVNLDVIEYPIYESGKVGWSELFR